MTEPRYRIVVALDLSEYAEIVLEHAIDQASRHDAPELHFVYVADDPKVDIDAVKARLAALVMEGLEDLECADWHVRLHVCVGKTAEEITNLAGEVRAQLIVLGRFGSHHRRLGAIAAGVIDLAPCATLVVGLAGDDDSAAKKQCADCVELRATSDGQRWFCSRHAGDRVRLSTIVVPGASWRSGPMW